MKPPSPVAAAAKKGLELRAKFKRGGTAVGVARARDIKNQADLSQETIARMRSFFARHGAQLNRDKGWDDKDPSPQYIAWLLWGGDPGRKWVNSMKENRMDRAKDLIEDLIAFKVSQVDEAASDPTSVRHAVTAVVRFQKAHEKTKRVVANAIAANSKPADRESGLHKSLYKANEWLGEMDYDLKKCLELLQEASKQSS